MLIGKIVGWQLIRTSLFLKRPTLVGWASPQLRTVEKHPRDELREIWREVWAASAWKKLTRGMGTARFKRRAETLSRLLAQLILDTEN